MARRVRDEIATLTAAVEGEGRWSRQDTLRALRIQRLLDALSAMTRRTRALCAKILRAAMKQDRITVAKL
jgi:hypothetical protein